MFKLISISGANRGQSYVLSEKTTLGRKEDNNIVLSSSKISKNHCVLEIKNNELTVKDLNSSNGTFVNGFLVQEKKLISGDQILVGNFVFQVVNTQSNKKINHEQVIVKNEKSEIDIMQSSLSLENKQPKNIKDKVIHFLENQFMNFFYNLNKKYEWKSIFISLIFFLILINAVLSVGPLLELNNNFVIQETGRRALFMAKQIANQNTYFISSKNETKTDVSFLENESGVRIAMILDFNNRIIAPANQLNQYFSNFNYLGNISFANLQTQILGVAGVANARITNVSTVALDGTILNSYSSDFILASNQLPKLYNIVYNVVGSSTF